MSKSLKSSQTIYRPRLTQRQIELILEALSYYNSSSSMPAPEAEILQKELQIFYGKIELSLSAGLAPSASPKLSSKLTQDQIESIKIHREPTSQETKTKALVAQATIILEFQGKEAGMKFIELHGLENEFPDIYLYPPEDPESL